MKSKNKFLIEAENFLKGKYNLTEVEKIMNYAFYRYENLCQENINQSKEVKQHTFKDIYPAIAIYEGMKSIGENQDNAIKNLGKFLDLRAEKEARQIRSLLKIPGLYKLMPKIFKKVTLNTFGEKAGFKAKFYDVGKRRVKFDMQKCLYCCECERYNCFEIVKCFCHTDDIKDGNMHKNLRWQRTKTMGEGCDICDFDLVVISEKDDN